MAKVVCEDCGDVIAEGVDPDTAEDIAEGHTHGDTPHLHDKRDDAEQDENEGGSGDASGGVSQEWDYEADPDEMDESDGEGNAPEAADDTADDASVDDELADMDNMDGDREAGDWWDVSDNDDYREVDGEFVRRFEEVRAEVEKGKTEHAQRVEHRDTQIEEDPVKDWKHGTISARIKQSQAWKDLRDDVVEAFSDLKTRDVPKRSRKGNTVNIDAVVQREAGDKSRDRLFYRKDQAARGDRAIGVSCDFSGSMHERRVKMALAAVAEATRVIGDDFVANCWTDDRSGRFGTKRGWATVGTITGKDEDFEWSHLDAYECGGGTPTADGVDDMRDMLEDMTAREKVMIVVTDGRPNTEHQGPGGSITGDPVQDAAHKVRKARQDGIKVIGLGVGSINSSTMGAIFGPDGFVSGSMDNLAARLVEVYRRQINV